MLILLLIFGLLQGSIGLSCSKSGPNKCIALFRGRSSHSQVIPFMPLRGFELKTSRYIWGLDQLVIDIYYINFDINLYWSLYSCVLGIKYDTETQLESKDTRS